MGTTVTVNPITAEVIEAGLRYVAREMRATLIRLSYSPILYETHDFSCALLDTDGEIVAMSVDVPLHIFPVSFGVRHLHEQYGDDLNEDDMFIVNDPWIAGTHLNDVLMIRPIFVDGNLELYSAVRAHYGDVGGMTPGSVSGNSTEILHEGVRIPLVRVYETGELRSDLLNLFLSNVRAPFQAEGVFYAQAAVNRLADDRVGVLYDRYGREAMRSTLDARMELARSRMADAIRALPDGEYYYEDYLENSGGSGENKKPIYARARMRVEDDVVSFDFYDCSPQRAGVGNADLATTWCGAYTVLETMLADDPSTTTGSVKQLQVSAPESSVLNSSPPVPVGGFADILFGPVQGCATGLLAQVVPERVSALAGSSANQTNIGGTSHPKRPGQAWFIFEFPWGGWPAVRDMDGNISSSQWYMGDLPMLWPVERGELANPIRAVFSGLRPDSGGPGYRRGGVGIIRAWEILADGQFSFLGSEGILPRPGMSTGYGGALNQLHVLRDGRELEVSEVPLKVGGFPLEPGDVIVTLAAGGAGYGDPLEREPDRVSRDVEDGYVSPEGARNDYGVVIIDGAVDSEATQTLRQELREAREYVTVQSADSDDYDEDGRRIARLSPQSAQRMGVEDEDLVEFVAADRPAVRAWVKVDQDVADGSTPLGSYGRRMCGVESGGRIWIRRPWTHAAEISELTSEFFASHELVRGVPL